MHYLSLCLSVDVAIIALFVSRSCLPTVQITISRSYSTICGSVQPAKCTTTDTIPPARSNVYEERLSQALGLVLFQATFTFMHTYTYMYVYVHVYMCMYMYTFTPGSGRWGLKAPATWDRHWLHGHAVSDLLRTKTRKNTHHRLSFLP